MDLFTDTRAIVKCVTKIVAMIDTEKLRTELHENKGRIERLIEQTTYQRIAINETRDALEELKEEV